MREVIELEIRDFERFSRRSLEVQRVLAAWVDGNFVKIEVEGEPRPYTPKPPPPWIHGGGGGAP